MAEVRRDLPLFLVANEFFDALPVRQFVKSERGWHERMVTAENGVLRFALAPEPAPSALAPAQLAQSERGAIFEVNAAAESIVSDIAARVVKTGGVALLIDYGHAQSGTGETLQAVREHDYVDPLDTPGEADLTAHVDFAALATVARTAGAEVFGPVTQAQFLEALGLGLRAQSLKQKSPQHAGDIDAAVQRLTGADEMGTLFKVMAIASPQHTSLQGF
jgi:NADH dehydrogenase [ubiquinone] 1 alpha subcomplex assembly factor 7